MTILSLIDLKKYLRESDLKTNNQLPLVCIFIPVYNAADTIKETLESILVQTYKNIIIHVVDNASTDKTLIVVKSFKEPRVKIHRYTKNIRGEGNFNRCIRLAEGKYMAIFHADDVYEKNIVEKQVLFLEANPEVAAVFTEATLINQLGNKIGNIKLPRGVYSKSNIYNFITMFKAVLKHSNFFICPSVMVRTKVYKYHIKYWNGEKFKTSADLDVWFRIMLNYPIAYLKEQLIRYRISNSQGSSKIRSSTERSDFFLVIDYYMSQEFVRNFLTETDISNYQDLDRRDRVMRAVNSYLINSFKEANDLIRDLISIDIVPSSLINKRRLFSFLLSFYLKLLMLSGFNRFGKLSLMFMKNITRK